jgi:hypothetical protein
LCKTRQFLKGCSSKYQMAITRIYQGAARE